MGLSDGAEVDDYGTDPVKSDTDADGLSDGEEVNSYGTNPLSSDTDEDGLSDGEEVNSYETDPLSRDSDGDGESDGDEKSAGTDPLVANEINPSESPEIEPVASTSVDSLEGGGDEPTAEVEPATDVGTSESTDSADAATPSASRTGGAFPVELALLLLVMSILRLRFARLRLIFGKANCPTDGWQHTAH